MHAGPARGGEVAAESDAIRDALAVLWSKARMVLVARRVMLVAAWVVGVAVALALLDYALRVPGWLRSLTLPVWIGVLWVTARRWLVPAWRFRPSATDLALRVERAIPELRGKLASAVDLALGRGALPTENSRKMAAVVVRSAAEAWGGRSASALVRTDGLRRSARGFGAAMIVCLGLLAVSPAYWWIGVQRVFVPWGGAAWPKRTGVADATGTSVHPLGESLPLRAVVTRSPLSPDRTDVVARYRLIAGGVPGAWRTELLTWQNREASTEVSTSDALGRETRSVASGPLFERLIDPAGEALEYRLSTDDDQTPTRTVRLVPPPALVSARAVITPPGYSGGEALNLDMGAGSDERAIAPSSLRGSRVELTLTMNKPSRIEPALMEQLRLVGGSEAAKGAVAGGSGSVATLEWTLGDPVRLVIRPIDEYGIAAPEDFSLRFDSSDDKPAEATITEPSTDRTVLATALVNVVAEGRDDVGLKWVSLRRQTAKPAGRPGGEKSPAGGAVEPAGEPEIVATEQGVRAKSLSVRSEVDLAVLGLRPGDEVRLTALAKDVYADENGERRESVSAVRTLRVISEAQFIEEVRRELGQVRQSAIRIDAQQGEVQERAASVGADRQVRRGQAQVSERLSRQDEAVQRVQERVRENGLTDPSLGDLLNQAKDALQQAGRASARAGKALDQAAGDTPEQDEDKPIDPAKVAKAGEARTDQEGVREQMRRLAELLDKGQDNWVVKSRLSGMVKAQNELREQTRELGARTAGKPMGALNQQERNELQAIVEKQTQLAEQVSKLTREMRERAEELGKSDAAAAKGMQDAAQRGDQQQVSESMKSAASSAQQNRMSDAGQSQEQATQAMKKMLEDLDSGEQQRALVLKRKLQEIAEAIERLVKGQERELSALSAAQQAQNGYAGLDTGMIRLNQNTLGVGDQARSMRDLEPVAKLLGKAGDAQASAVQGLRSERVDPDPVRADETVSLDALRTALERARELNKKLDDQEQARKTAELKSRYREALEKQSLIRGETEGFSKSAELSRRERVLVRRLGEQQGEVRAMLGDVRQQTKELAEATVFDYAHTRLDAMTSGAATALENADPRAALSAQDGTITTLKNLIEALTDPRNDSKFSSGAGGGGGGGGGAGKKRPLIPPAKELRLLRMMQAEVASMTAVAEKGGDISAVDSTAKLQREISEVGSRLLKKLSPGGGGDDPVIPFGPAPKEGDGPVPPAPPAPGPGADRPAPGTDQARAARGQEVARVA